MTSILYNMLSTLDTRVLESETPKYIFFNLVILTICSADNDKAQYCYLWWHWLVIYVFYGKNLNTSVGCSVHHLIRMYDFSWTVFYSSPLFSQHDCSTLPAVILCWFCVRIYNPTSYINATLQRHLSRNGTELYKLFLSVMRLCKVTGRLRFTKEKNYIPRCESASQLCAT